MLLMFLVLFFGYMWVRDIQDGTFLAGWGQWFTWSIFGTILYFKRREWFRSSFPREGENE
jgi:hypothetical protein